MLGKFGGNPLMGGREQLGQRLRLTPLYISRCTGQSIGYREFILYATFFRLEVERVQDQVTFKTGFQMSVILFASLTPEGRRDGL